MSLRFLISHHSCFRRARDFPQELSESTFLQPVSSIAATAEGIRGHTTRELNKPLPRFYATRQSSKAGANSLNSFDSGPRGSTLEARQPVSLLSQVRPLLCALATLVEPKIDAVVTSPNS